ncbi:MAG: hypothetical protein R2827_02360 [Bdellovibrionales bacterium]
MILRSKPFVQAAKIEKTLEIKSYEEFKKSEHLIDLTWPEIALARGYKLKFNGKEYNSKSNTLSLRMPATTGQKFTVVALNEKGVEVSKESAPVGVDVRKILVVKTPQLRSPENNSKMVSMGSADEFVIFEWMPIKDATNYEIQFSSDADFKNIFFEKSVNENTMILDQVIEEKRVYWRVRAIVEKHKSDWSRARNFNL